MDLKIGSTIGDYQVVGVLGAGGMGSVYQVRNLISDRVEALKVLLPDLSGDPAWPNASSARSRSWPAWITPTSRSSAPPSAPATRS